jgi:hypothetical protein
VPHHLAFLNRLNKSLLDRRQFSALADLSGIMDHRASISEAQRAVKPIARLRRRRRESFDSRLYPATGGFAVKVRS